MSEPSTRATAVLTPSPGLWHWTLHDERIDFRSDAFAVQAGEGFVAIDPLPLEDAALERLRPLIAICITAGCHQRSAWSLRERTGAPVHAPAGAAGLVAAPDVAFSDGAWLPGGLRAWHRPGPTDPHYVFHWPAPGGSALFCGDLLMRQDSEPFAFVPDDHQDDPGRSRRSVRRLLDLAFDHLCPAHGTPALGDGVEQVRIALERDQPWKR